VTPWSKRTMAACADGRSTVIGTRRSRDHGDTMLQVSSAGTQICQLGASRCSVSAQNSAIDDQPPMRWVSSNTLCARLRTAGAAPTTTTSASSTSP
jgi:hypothetical protein